MNYKEVLSPYQPLEVGDFMHRYDINNHEYIVYSPEKNKISCLDLYHFTDITSFQLAVSIQRIQIVEQEQEEEFSFSKVCSREDLIKYLFDIVDDQTEYRKIRGVSNFEAYLLYDLKQSKKIRNMFHFNPNNNEYQLVFENDVCVASIYHETITNIINICWNPVIFKTLEEKPERNTSYLLPSSNPMLCTYICKVVEEHSPFINLYGSGNSLSALLFFSYYINNRNIEKSMCLFSDSKRITIEMKEWNPITLVKFVSKIQRIYNVFIRNLYEEESESTMTVYQLLSIAGTSFVIFPNDEIVINIFLKEIMNEYRLESISYQSE